VTNDLWRDEEGILDETYQAEEFKLLERDELYCKRNEE
jgi:hypothetical protein